MGLAEEELGIKAASRRQSSHLLCCRSFLLESRDSQTPVSIRQLLTDPVTVWLPGFRPGGSTWVTCFGVQETVFSHASP